MLNMEGNSKQIQAMQTVDSLLTDMLKKSNKPADVLSALCRTYSKYTLLTDEWLEGVRGADLPERIRFDKFALCREICKELKREIIYYAMLANGFRMDNNGMWRE